MKVMLPQIFAEAVAGGWVPRLITKIIKQDYTQQIHEEVDRQIAEGKWRIKCEIETAPVLSITPRPRKYRQRGYYYVNHRVFMPGPDPATATKFESVNEFKNAVVRIWI